MNAIFRWYLVCVALVAVSMALMVSCKSIGSHGEDDENEVEMSLDQVPAPVRATILREAKGQKIEEVERTGEGADAIYEVDLMMDGQEYELKVSATGEVISKKLDD